MMNLFIALLTITYESAKDQNQIKTNFARITHTIELDKKSSMMPPPLNIVVFALTLLFFAVAWLVTLASCGFWMVRLQRLYPIHYSLRDELRDKQKRAGRHRTDSLPAHGTHRRSGHGRDRLHSVEDDHEHEHDDDEESGSDAEDAEQGRHAQRVYCGCLVRLDRGYRESNWLSNLNTQRRIKWQEEYCRHCRHHLSRGDISKYFELFRAGAGAPRLGRAEQPRRAQHAEPRAHDEQRVAVRSGVPRQGRRGDPAQ